MVTSIELNLLSDEFGTNQINNLAAKNAGAVEDKNFDKVLTSASKKTVKQNLSEVEDYFEFDLSCFSNSDSFLNENESEVSLHHDDLVFDEDAERVINIARISALFDC